MNTIVLCPGFHSPTLTQSFLEQFEAIEANWLVFPAEQYPAYSSPDILRFVSQRVSGHSDTWLKTSLILIGFSAGVAGAMGAAWTIEQWGGTVRALFALDGWGVPAIGCFPTHRLSHDYFTHWSSALLGAGGDSFYADPAVKHLELWRSPHKTNGKWISSNSQSKIESTTAAQFLLHWLRYYE